MPRLWLPFTPNRLPIVPISFQEERTFALLDTGAEISFVSPQLATRFALPRTGRGPIIGLTGQVELAEKTRLDGLRLGPLTLGSLDARIVEVERLGTKIKLILGVNALRHRKWQIHFNEGRVYFLD